MILNLFKKEGETPLQRINRLKNERADLQSEKMTYAGRLDPMAEGVLIVLSGDDVHKKDVYLKLDKVYEFEVLWGVSSDTYDILGEVTVAGGSPDDAQLKADVGGFVGTIEIPYPAYSSRTVLGRPLWSYARSGELEEIEFPKKSMSIISLSFNHSRELSNDQMLNEVDRRVTRIEGDFRQGQILEKWKEEIIRNPRKVFKLSSFTAKVSSGTYIRSLAVRLGEKYNTRSLAWKIKRTNVGNFSIKDSI